MSSTFCCPRQPSSHLPLFSHTEHPKSFSTLVTWPTPCNSSWPETKGFIPKNHEETMVTPIMRVWICWGLQALELSPMGSSQLVPDHVTQSSQLGDGEKSFSPGKQNSSWDVALTRVVITAFLPTMPELGKMRADAREQFLSAIPGILQLTQLKCCSIARLPGRVLRAIRKWTSPASDQCT